MSLQAIERAFPRLPIDGYRKTSEEDPSYNCFAFAGGDDTEKWDPRRIPGRYWPEDVPRSLDISSFIKLYEHEGGYSECDNGDLEPGYEKIALFWELDIATGKNNVSHAAIQSEDGQWNSKIGDLEDIKHKLLSSLEGSWYGTLTSKFLKRSRTRPEQ